VGVIDHLSGGIAGPWSAKSNAVVPASHFADLLEDYSEYDKCQLNVWNFVPNLSD
jgi:hypothetical protein